jgi:hypothetical protein
MFFKSFMSTGRPRMRDCLEKAALIGRYLAKEIGRKKPFRLLIEVTPVKEGQDLFDVGTPRMWNNRNRTFDAFPYDLKALDGFLSKHRFAYIFSHPDDEQELKALSRKVWNKAFRNATGGQ